MKISDFVSQMSSGMARTNRFSVMLTLPDSLSGEGLTPLRDLLLFCDQVQLPGITVNTVPNRTFGEVRETPTEFNYEPLQLSFYVDANMHIKAYFDGWAKSLQYGQERTFRYYDEYTSPQMQVMVQDTLDQTRFQVTLYEVYPKSIGAVQMDYASKDIMKLSVTFQYKYWEYTTVPVDTTRSLGQVVPDLYNVKQIPQQYMSNFNDFQSNLAGNVKSNVNSQLGNLNAQLNQGINNLRGTVNGVVTEGINDVINFF